MSTSKEARCAVVVSSVDHFSDIWPQFFHFFFKHWQQPSWPVYLIANYRRFGDDRVTTLTLGRDRQWGSNLLLALEQIEADCILYMQDDYLLSAPVNNAFIQQAAEALHASPGPYLNLFCPSHETVPVAGLPFDEVNRDLHWYVTLQAALWKTHTLRELVQPGWTPWDAETELNAYGKARGGKGIYTLNKTHADVFPYLQAVKGGFWLHEAVEFCQQHKVRVNKARRPCPPWGESFWKRKYRSLLKRKMKLSALLESRLARNKVVEPLPDSNLQP